MKKAFMCAVAASILIAPAALSQVVPDSETLSFDVSGYIQSECILESPNINDGDVIDLGELDSVADFLVQPIGSITFGCNSPYELSLTSDFGGLLHQESGGVFDLEYVIRTTGTENGSPENEAFDSDALQGGELLADIDDWENIAFNLGNQIVSIDLEIPDLNRINVAGTYRDTLTLDIVATDL